MGRLSDDPDDGAMERDFSPDRRIALDFRPYPDPRSDYEAKAPESVQLRDAETGRTLAEFGGWAMILRHEWPVEGGVILTLPKGAGLRVAPDLASFAPMGETARPIAELPNWLGTLAPPPPPPIPPLTWAQRALLVCFIILCVALVSLGLAFAFGFPD